MEFQEITDLDIQALIDGEMDERRGLDLIERIRRNPILLNRYNIYKKQKDLLKLWWKDN